MGQKGPPTNFSPVTSTNVRISPENFLTFSFNPFTTLVLIVLTLLPNWYKFQGHTKIDRNFWSNPYKIEVMIASLTEMLELPNFGHMTKTTT